MSAELFSAGSEDEKKAPPYSWTEALLCGHGGIDRDHRRIFDIAERLRSVPLQAEEQAAIGQILAELLEYVHGHFGREEALMRAINYPQYADHQFEHSLLLQHMQKLHDEFLSGKPISQKEVGLFLRRWLRYHIMNADMQMAQYATQASSAHNESADRADRVDL